MMGHIHDTDGSEFNGATLETRSESFKVGVPTDQLGMVIAYEDHTVVEFAYTHIPMLRRILHMAEEAAIKRGNTPVPCEDCTSYWDRKGVCAHAESIAGHGHPGRLWREPSVAPPWCPKVT